MTCSQQDSAGQSSAQSQEMDMTVGFGVKFDKMVGEKLHSGFG